MFTDTITLFNLHKGLWYPHVLHDVDAVGIANGASATALNGTTRSDNGVILIQTNSSKVIKVGNTLKPYVMPKSYELLENGADAITFQPQTDFIYTGEYESTEPVLDDAYNEGFYDWMNRKRDGVYQIVSAVYYSLIPHFEIGVK